MKNIQELIVFSLFAGAIGYLVRIFYKSIISKRKFGNECTKCSENTVKTDKSA